MIDDSSYEDNYLIVRNAYPELFDKAVEEKHDKDSVIYKRYQIALKTIEDILETY